MPPKADATVKVLLLGESGVGKSSLMISFASGTFNPEISTTIGIDFKVKTVEVVDAEGQRKHVNLHIWDTAGQERFRTLTSSYYRGAHAVVLVYDVNEPRTFAALENWLAEAQTFCAGEAADQTVYLLIGNKIDRCASDPLSPPGSSSASPGPGPGTGPGLPGSSSSGSSAGLRMAVPRAEATAFAQRHRTLLAFTSAKTRAGVAQAFDELARSVYDKVRANGDAAAEGRRLKGANSSQGGGGCC